MAEQISVFIQNKPGKIASVTRALSSAKIDIRALSIADTTDFGVLRMLVSDTAGAKKVLEEQNCIVSITGVTVVVVPDEPGGLADVLTMFDTEGIDIEYMYSLIGRVEGKAYMVFRVSDEKQLFDLLEKNGLKTASGAELGLK